MWEKNLKKMEVFLEVAKLLNDKYLVTPLLYGSLGLSRAIEQDFTVNDIDVLLPQEIIEANWRQLQTDMQEMEFFLTNEAEHEFNRDGQAIAFAPLADLYIIPDINLAALPKTFIQDVKFFELTPEYYLKVYTLMLRDNYRQEKRGNADQEKIKMINQYLKAKKSGSADGVIVLD